MRLEKIKLAGFKSFVDPTSVGIPSNLVGIVGPNGCGKSNVIDAVRWVMGESSAKMLRGESMADVIFNGSNSRKPVGQASIELVFDNTEGRAGGQYAQFNQISVRRVVTREGQSNYFLNGSRCRRRDITDLFLGTGLGPRSYSIIEQGMISRLIEARPEDLRLFLEEAAGISKYKERRRETENRIRHTRENLERLNDLREELAKQLEHLKRQATVAEKYKELKEKERRLKAELLALRQRALAGQINELEGRLSQLEGEKEKSVARLRGLEARIAGERERYTETNDRFNERQGLFYAVGSEIARIEQAQKFARENRASLEQEVERVKLELREATENSELDQQRLEEAAEQLATEEPRRDELSERESQAEASIGELEQRIKDAEAEWEAFNREAAQPAQTAQVERTKMNHLEQRDEERRIRKQKLSQELERLDPSSTQAEVEELAEQLTEQELVLAELEEGRPRILEEIESLRAAIAERTTRLNETRSEVQRQSGRMSALATLQKEALGETDRAAGEWLRQHRIDESRRLARQLDVTPRWQGAVEQVLGDFVQALELDRLDQLEAAGGRLEKGRLAFVSAAQGEPPVPPQEGEWLIGQTRSGALIGDLLRGIRIADDATQAWRLRGELGPGESLITPDGLWLGRNWMRIQGGEAEQGGVLERESQLKELQQVIAEAEQREAILKEENERDGERLRQSEQRREGLQNELSAAERLLSNLGSELNTKRARLDQLQARRQQLQHELEELGQREEADREAMEESRSLLHQALEQMEQFAEQREEMARSRESLREQLEQARNATREVRTELRALEQQISALRSSHDSLAANLQREEGRVGQLRARQQELIEKLEESGEPLEGYAEQLEQQLARRVEVEKELGEARAELEEVEGRLRQLEKERGDGEQGVNRANDRMNDTRVKRQEVLVRLKTVEEQLRESGFDAAELVKELAENADPGEWERQLTDLDARIRRLGAINLAAIEEYKERHERSSYLDEQHRDISDSLETLESAIQKIDKETRGRFKETFERVNNGLKEKFPQLFGGGHAYLELTGDDLLNTGVTVMARPPGKRNSSIHLLSGGEKALTAVALVFSIFELNPAPFCMLDEVDAPLDDANVGRFCELVKTMSERVQFIIISHNKITMEIANQLMGVTMHEPGVSRLVSVDVNEAVKLAAA
jgi:chromosome segregation protein